MKYDKGLDNYQNVSKEEVSRLFLEISKLSLLIFLYYSTKVFLWFYNQMWMKIYY